MEFNPLLYNEKYRIQTNRLTDMAYGEGFYHVVVCTKDRRYYLGNIYDDEMHYSLVGGYAKHNIEQLAQHYTDVIIHSFQVMPNHIHLLLQILPSEKDIQLNAFGKTGRLGVIIRGLKSAVSKWANEQNIEFGWQSRYYDTVIRHPDQYSETDYYIQNNVLRWSEDKLHLPTVEP
mgnify:CR=1 FL=1